MPTPPTPPPDRQTLVSAAFGTWFNSKYAVLVSDELLQKWQLIDTCCQIGICVTAAGSCIAGWQLWAYPGLKILWAVISGCISLAALAHKSFDVAGEVRKWSDARRVYATLTNQLETLKYEVDTAFDKDPDRYQTRYLDIRESYQEQDKTTPGKDLLLTEPLQHKIKKQVFEDARKTNFEKELTAYKSTLPH